MRLDQARAHLAATCAALNGWYARRSGEGRSYVADGHEAVRLIDAATQQLHRVRAALIGEIRADEDERAARVDHLLAECRARQATVRPVAVGPARPAQPPAPAVPKKPATGTARRSLAQTRELAAQVRAQHPEITQAELARRLGISATRLRQVDKAEVRTEVPRPINHSNGAVRSGVSA